MTKSNKINQSSRQKNAIERQAKWNKLTPKEQLADLDKRLGKDIGAKKQRARLAKLI